MVRTSYGSSDISAIPPTLSVMGPYESTATTMATIGGIAAAASATP
jgi:hypothetical protein